MKHLKKYTKDQFIKNFGDNERLTEALLRNWIDHYSLNDKFQQEQTQPPPIQIALRGPLDEIDMLMQEKWAPQWVAAKTTLGKRFRETGTDSDTVATKKIASVPPQHESEAMDLKALEPSLNSVANPMATQATTDSSNQNVEPTKKPPQPEAMAPSMDEPPGDDADDQQKAADKELVAVFPPEKGWSWYLGDPGDPLYLRCNVTNMGQILRMELEEPKEEKEGPMEGNAGNEEQVDVKEKESNAKVFVISGAAGIGKSWSINAFMTELLASGTKVFFHSGAYKRAWMIHKVDNIEHNLKPENVMALGKEWVYVYDSPGATDPVDRAKARTGRGKVTYIFSSPKAINYEIATNKGNGPAKILHLPSWTKAEMSEVYADRKEAVGASYDIWGGNMRAFDKFADEYRKNPDEAKQEAEKELDIHIGKIDKDFAEKMVKKLEKQDVQGKFIGDDVQNSPGHILTPEPTITDPEVAKCFEEFQWRFCSPLAEKKFWQHVKGMDHGLLKNLLLSVFQTPSPKGVLFEKIAHLMLTNGVVEEFYWCPYNTEGEERKVTTIKFPKCEQVWSFENDEDLGGKLREARKTLGGTVGAIALEPKNTSYDAVDMFVLIKTGATDTIADWLLYMLRDTISKTHTFHPVKILWYCSLFCGVFNEEVTGDFLPRCKYIPVVPHATTDFKLQAPKSTSDLEELKAVAKLLGVWPCEFDRQKLNLTSFVNAHSLVIPPTKDEKPRQRLDKKTVATAFLLEKAASAVMQECRVIFDVVNTA